MEKFLHDLSVVPTSGWHNDIKIRLPFQAFAKWVNSWTPHEFRRLCTKFRISVASLSHTPFMGFISRLQKTLSQKAFVCPKTAESATAVCHLTLRCPLSLGGGGTVVEYVTSFSRNHSTIVIILTTMKLSSGKAWWQATPGRWCQLCSVHWVSAAEVQLWNIIIFLAESLDNSHHTDYHKIVTRKDLMASTVC